MIKINGTPLNVTMFPDQTSQVWKVSTLEIPNTNWVHVSWEYSNEGEFLQIAQLKDLLDAKGFEATLRIKYLPYGRVGTAYVTNQENKRHVGCLITSFSYGNDRDSVEDIVAQTFLALDSFFKDRDLQGKTIYSNKFNSGMFKVDWRYTEKVLKYFVKRYDVEWVICDPDME